MINVKKIARPAFAAIYLTGVIITFGQAWNGTQCEERKPGEIRLISCEEFRANVSVLSSILWPLYLSVKLQKGADE